MAQADPSQPADTEVTPVRPEQPALAPRARAPEPDHHPISLNQPFDRDTLVSLRSAVAAHAGNLGLKGERLELLVVAVHELATNAVRHGGGSGRLMLWRDGDRVCCQVSDAGPGMGNPDVASWRRLPPVQAEGGRGLYVIQALADEVSVATNGEGTTVTVTFALG
jgi:anti-sigma regulatory factor (Ser/Thr protein kinase)